MFLLFGLIIGLIVWGIIRFIRRDESITEHTPLEIAKQRYAKGEISKEEFEQIKKDIYK